ALGRLAARFFQELILLHKLHIRIFMYLYATSSSGIYLINLAITRKLTILGFLVIVLRIADLNILFFQLLCGYRMCALRRQRLAHFLKQHAVARGILDAVFLSTQFDGLPSWPKRRLDFRRRRGNGRRSFVQFDWVWRISYHYCVARLQWDCLSRLQL